jgi:hypothetical protein
LLINWHLPDACILMQINESVRSPFSFCDSVIGNRTEIRSTVEAGSARPSRNRRRTAAMTASGAAAVFIL